MKGAGRRAGSNGAASVTLRQLPHQTAMSCIHVDWASRVWTGRSTAGSMMRCARCRVPARANRDRYSAGVSTPRSTSGGMRLARDTPLNTRQLDVLRWISDGCPDGRWTDSTYKTTAKSLENRRLVVVTKKGGWSATIDPAGVHSPKRGYYPADHFPNKRRSYSRTMRLAHSEAGTPQRPLTRPAPNGPTPTRKLLQDVIDAGGVLEFNTRGDETNFGNLVAIINRRQMAPYPRCVMVSASNTRVPARIAASTGPGHD